MRQLVAVTRGETEGDYMVAASGVRYKAKTINRKVKYDDGF